MQSVWMMSAQKINKSVKPGHSSVQLAVMDRDPSDFTTEGKKGKVKPSLLRPHETQRGESCMPRVTPSQRHCAVFKLVILSQIRDIAFIPETSWSYSGGISVVLLINQTSAVSRESWRTEGLMYRADSERLLCRFCPAHACFFSAWESHAGKVPQTPWYFLNYL